MAAQTTPLDALARVTWTTRDSLAMAQVHLSDAHTKVVHHDLERALAAAKRAADQANAAVAALTAATILTTTIDLSDSDTVEGVRAKITSIIES